MLAQLFGVDRSVITKYLKNIFESDELRQESVCAKNALTAADGKNYQTTLYNLDAISVSSLSAYGLFAQANVASGIRLRTYMRNAEQEYDIFNKTQKIDSDFDKEIRKLKGE